MWDYKNVFSQQYAETCCLVGVIICSKSEANLQLFTKPLVIQMQIFLSNLLKTIEFITFNIALFFLSFINTISSFINDW